MVSNLLILCVPFIYPKEPNVYPEKPNVCCCIYHVELEELKVGFNYIWKTYSLHAKDACNCSCEEVCQAIDDHR